MSGATSNLERLIDLAKEPESDKRRDLLREVTDVFIGQPDQFSDTEITYFGDIMEQLASSMELEVRAQLSAELSLIDQTPRSLAVQLASDEIKVAEPMLVNSRVLQDEDLISIAGDKSQGHLNAMARREDVSEAVTDAIVLKADDSVLETLARNDGARFSREGMEKLVDRSETNEALQAPVVSRRDVPMDLLNEMYFFVSQNLKQQILETNAGVDQASLEDALNKSRSLLQAKSAGRIERKSKIEILIDTLHREGELTEMKLVEFARNKQVNELIVGFAKMAELDIRTSRRVLFDKTCESLAIACRAISFDRSTFSTFALMMERSEGAASVDPYKAVELYNQIPFETAQRTMRFWRIRKQAEDAGETVEPQAQAASAS